MTLTHRFPHITGFALGVAVMFAAITMKAQTVISNETLATTTLVVNSAKVVAKCGRTGCMASSPMLTSIPVNCPAAIGATCTFDISLNTTVTVSLPCGGSGCSGWAGENSYQFLVDGAAPVPGPTDDAEGDYIFAEFPYSSSDFATRVSNPASVVASVTNSSSQNHVVNVTLRCTDIDNQGGCGIETHGTTMRIEVFEP